MKTRALLCCWTLGCFCDCPTINNAARNIFTQTHSVPLSGQRRSGEAYRLPGEPPLRGSPAPWLCRRSLVTRGCWSSSLFSAGPRWTPEAERVSRLCLEGMGRPVDHSAWWGQVLWAEAAGRWEQGKGAGHWAHAGPVGQAGSHVTTQGPPPTHWLPALASPARTTPDPIRPGS